MNKILVVSIVTAIMVYIVVTWQSAGNQEQRIQYEANPNLIIGKTITVQYFEESKNQQGELSLRFPTVKHVYENGRNV